MTIRLLPTALVLTLAATLFTLGLIAFDALDADRYVDESSTVQAKIREEAWKRRTQDAVDFYGDLRFIHEGRLVELENQLRTKKDGDSPVTDSGGAAAWPHDTQPTSLAGGYATTRRVEHSGHWPMAPAKPQTRRTPNTSDGLHAVTGSRTGHTRPPTQSSARAQAGGGPARTPESVASESIALIASAPEYTAYVVTGIGRTCIGEHDLIRPLLSGQRCPGTTYAPPSTIYVAVWSPRQPQQRCVCINFGDPPTKTRFYGEHRSNPDLTEWLLLPVPSSVRWLRDGSPSPDRFIEVKAFPLSRGCWSCTALGEGEVLLSRVDINLLPQIGWGGGVWP